MCIRDRVSNDLRRTEYLKVLGYHVLRFWNHEVLGDPDAVLESIRAALFEIPSPPRSPGEGVNGIPIDSAEEPNSLGMICDLEEEFRVRTRRAKWRQRIPPNTSARTTTPYTYEVV